MMRYLLLPLLAFALALSACGDDDGATTTPSVTITGQASATAAAQPSPTVAKQYTGKSITVMAASSLTAAFNEIGDQFSDETGAGVTFNFGGSSDLRVQLEQGAEADVFASADSKQMGLAKDSGVVEGDGTIFVRNRLVVIVPRDNEADITELADLAQPGIKISLADETVPVGRYARQFLDKGSAEVSLPGGYKDSVLANVVTNASSVKEVVSAVQLDEVDAGIVYTTDVTEDVEEDVLTIAIPDGLNVIATYPISVTAATREPEVARAFVDFVLGPAGQATLQSYGFLAPE
jgi:molybdate transport system substrate-binding protein